MKLLIILLNLCSLLIMASTSDVVGAAVRFIAVGEIPLTNSNLPPDGMLVIVSILTLTFILYLIPRHIAKKTINDLKLQRHRLPKQRYKRV